MREWEGIRTPRERVSLPKRKPIRMDRKRGEMDRRLQAKAKREIKVSKFESSLIRMQEKDFE